MTIFGWKKRCFKGEAENARLQERIAWLEARVAEVEAKNTQLVAENTQLVQKLAAAKKVNLP